MRVEYTLTMTAKCPVDQSTDVYEVTVTSDRTIPVEQIRAACRVLGDRPAYQEEITTELAKRLGATVKTVGVHSGVKTVAEANPCG